MGVTTLLQIPNRTIPNGTQYYPSAAGAAPPPGTREILVTLDVASKSAGTSLKILVGASFDGGATWREFPYDFAGPWTDPKTGVVHTDVWLGVGWPRVPDLIRGAVIVANGPLHTNGGMVQAGGVGELSRSG